MEEYRGVKFQYRLVDVELPDAELKRYLDLDLKLKEFLNPASNEGNMSMRTAEGFLIKCSGARVTELGRGDVSIVLGLEGDEVIAAGTVPSSESRMHYEIYGQRKDAQIVLHFHDDEMLGRFDGPAIGPFPYGTQELAKAAGEEAKKHKLFMIREHGFVLIANDEEELLEKIKGWKN